MTSHGLLQRLTVTTRALIVMAVVVVLAVIALAIVLQPSRFDRPHPPQ